LTVVDLPEPFGPSSPKTSPRRTSKSTLSTARAFGRFQKSLNTFVSPRTDTTTSALDCGSWIADCGFNSTTVINRKEAVGFNLAKYFPRRDQPLGKPSQNRSSAARHLRR